MSTQALSRLGTELGSPPPEGLRGLADSQVTLLTDALRDERAARAAGLEEAAEEALKLVPALARGPVRRILFK